MNNNFAFRFKQTQMIQLPKTNIKIIQDFDLLRKQILNFNYSRCMQGNLESCAELEKLLSLYIEKIDTIIDQSIQISIIFSWNDSYIPNKFVASTTIHFEYVNQLYNLGILYYYILINSQVLKSQIDAGRNALWCFQRLQEILSYVNSKTLEQISDLSFIHVYMIYNYISGFTYQKLYQHFSQDQQYQNSKMILFGLLNESIKRYDQTIRCLIQTKQAKKQQIPPIIYNQLMQLFNQNVTIAEANLFIELAIYLESIVQENLNEKRIGKALTYLNKAEESIKIYQKKYDSKLPILNQKMQQILVLRKEYTYKNQQIYKQELAKEYELLVLTLNQDYLKPRPPIVIQNRYDQVQQQYTRQQEQLLNLTQTIKTKKDKAYQSFMEVQSFIDTLNQKYNLQYILDATANAEQLKLTPSIQQKVDFIKQQGGWKGLQKNIEKIVKFQRESGTKIINLKNLLEQQKRMEGPPQQGHWLLSDQIEQFTRAIEDIQLKLQNASLVNKETEKQIFSVKEQIHFVEQSNNANIESKQQQSMNQSQKFYKENVILLKKVSTAMEVLNAKIVVIKAKLNQLEEYIDQLKLDQLKQTDQNMIDMISKEIDARIQDIDNIISGLKLADIEESTKKLSDKMQLITIANQTEQEFENNLQVIEEAFVNLEYATQFYDQISIQIEGIDKQIKSFMEQ